MAVMSNVAGYPRLGLRRELKFAVEAYWRGEKSAEELQAVAAAIRSGNQRFMRGAGIALVPSTDFSLYDHVLDAIALVGAVPPRYGFEGGEVDLDTYFAMARGGNLHGTEVTAMEMTKWFDTNYHYIVPELRPGMTFQLSSKKPFDEHEEGMAEHEINTVAVLPGPLTFLLLGKPARGEDDFDRLSLLPDLVAVYSMILPRLAFSGCEWVQFDEPALCQDRTPAEIDAFRTAYKRLAGGGRRPKICVKTYFDHVGDAYPALAALPVEGIGLDFVRGPRNEELVRAGGKLRDKTLFAGVVDGRNLWINDMDRSLAALRGLVDLCDDLVVSTSCSLLHVPIDADDEPNIPLDIRPWFAFARQKVGEVVTLTTAMVEGEDAVAHELEANRQALESRRTSSRTYNDEVRRAVAELGPTDDVRYGQYQHRRRRQKERFSFPLFPTTTTGSFPQTPEIRHARALFQKGETTREQYEEAMRKEMEGIIRFQEEAGLDALVHGEPERNDMVAYFAEELEGFIFTRNAWVQSYGSRGVRPPIIVGDVRRTKPITLPWITHAQSLTEKPVKGMLTGPVTLAMWSFVRDDQPLSDTCKQLALAVRAEVAELEKAGIGIIQVDEPALREGLPLRKDRRDEYVRWATYCFRLATACVSDETQIQTHMCYSVFGEVMDAIDAIDADVLLIKDSRSNADLLEDLESYGYPREVGLGVYDVHSPRVPPTEEMAEAIRLQAKLLPSDLVWVVPDCGLKTRSWDEAGPAVRNMIDAARQVRREFEGQP